MPSDLYTERLRVTTGSLNQYQWTVSAFTGTNPNAIASEPSGSLLRSSDGALWINTNGSTEWLRFGAGSMTCSYTADGSEGSQATVTLPAAYPDSNYKVFVTNVSGSSISAYQVPENLRTASNFKVNASAPFAANDKLDFLTVSGSIYAGNTAPASSLVGYGAGLFGSGIDGDLDFDGTTTITSPTGINSANIAPVSSVYTLTRDIYANDMDVQSGVTIITAGYRIFVAGTLTCNGTIKWNGADGGNGNAGAPAGSGLGGTAPVGHTTTNFTGGTAGGGGGNTGNGAPSAAGAMVGVSPYGRGVASTGTTAAGADGQYLIGGAGGGNGTGAGGSSGALVAASWSTGPGFFAVPVAMTGRDLAAARIAAGVGGGGGRGGTTGTSNGGGGGAGGSAGGIVAIYARVIAGSGTISADGGNAGNGGSQGAVGTGQAGAGGGGGPGGFVIIVSWTDPAAALTITANGGSGGAAGAVGGGGTSGGAGGSGFVIIHRLY